MALTSNAVLLKGFSGNAPVFYFKQFIEVDTLPTVGVKNVGYAVPTSATEFSYHYYDGSVWRGIAAGGAASVHNDLTGRGAADQHPQSAITGLSTALGLKVDKVTGKELSSNDYTDLEKNNLSNQSGSNTGDQDLSGLQETLVSGTNIKTVNSTSLLGSGDIEISGGSSDSPQTLTFASTMTPVLADGNIITVTMTNDGTMNVPSDMTAGQLFQFRKIQDGSGGNVLTWAAGFKFNGGVTPVQTGTALSIDEFTFRAISATEASFQYIGYDA